MERIQFSVAYEEIISAENLLDAWVEFKRGKSKRKDVQEYGRYLMHNVLALHADLVQGTYIHAPYEHFRISDPKPRDIHKATVRDRLLHHALYRKLYPFFDRTFIADSYSCREGKGTHKAMNRFRAFAYQVSKNNTRTCWILKCDIRKFFASIDHAILKTVLAGYIPDSRTLSLLSNIINSFCATPGVAHRGLPLGNLTSQLLVNIYMNEFDQFTKHTLKATHYIRYADDFVFLHKDRNYLESLVPRISDFFQNKLKLSLHPDKLHLKTLSSGVDFLGWVHFPDHRVLRTSSKRRMFRRLEEVQGKEETTLSYLGMLRQGNTWGLREEARRLFSLR